MKKTRQQKRKFTSMKEQVKDQQLLIFSTKNKVLRNFFSYTNKFEHHSKKH